MAIKDGYIRWSDEAVGAIRWDTEEKEGMAVVIDEANGETYEIGGGGGDSDFSTANVTINVTGETENVTANLSTYMIILDGGIISDMGYCEYGDTTFQVVLYKNSMTADLECDSITSHSGDVTIDDTTLTITGDCTITCVGIPFN